MLKIPQSPMILKHFKWKCGLWWAKYVTIGKWCKIMIESFLFSNTSKWGANTVLFFELINCILIHRDLYEALLLLRLLLFDARFFKRFPLRWDLGSIMMIQNIHIARRQNSLFCSKKAESGQIKIESWCEKETNRLQTFPRKQPATCSPNFCKRIKLVNIFRADNENDKSPEKNLRSSGSFWTFVIFLI